MDRTLLFCLVNLGMFALFSAILLLICAFLKPISFSGTYGDVIGGIVLTGYVIAGFVAFVIFLNILEKDSNDKKEREIKRKV